MMSFPITLSRGGHNKPEDGMCLMEAVAYLANEPHSDSPHCASPALAAFGRMVNDRCPDDVRQDLLSLAVMLIGTRLEGEIEQQRAEYLVRQVCIRVVGSAIKGEGGAALIKAATSGSLLDIGSAARATRATPYAAAACAARAADAACAGSDVYAASAAASAAIYTATGDARADIWDEMFAIFREAIEIGRDATPVAEDVLARAEQARIPVA